MFNEGGYLDRYRRGELYERVRESAPPNPALPFPVGTLSQRVAWYDRQTHAMVAVIHRYLLPTGKLGGSGLPDPKRLYIDDTIYYV